MDQDVAPRGGSWVWRSPVGEAGLDAAGLNSAQPVERQRGGRHARSDETPSQDAWESASDVDVGFQQVAPGVVYVPTSPQFELLDAAAAPDSAVGAAASTGAWEGSSRAPSGRARGCHAAGKHDRAAQPVLSRRRITWAGIVGLAIACGALFLLGSGVRPSGAAPPVIGGPDASMSGSGPSGQASAVGPQLVFDAATGPGMSPSLSGGQATPTPGSISSTPTSSMPTSSMPASSMPASSMPTHEQQDSSEEPGDRPTLRITEKPTGQPTQRRSYQDQGKSRETPAGQPTQQRSDQDQGKSREKPTGQPTQRRSDQDQGRQREKPTGQPSPTASASRGRLGPSSAAGPPDRSEPDWQEVITRLDRVRAKSLTQLDDGVLAGAVAPGSAAWEADTALLAALRARGLHPLGLHTQVVAVLRIGDPAAVDTMTANAAVPAEAVLSRGAGVTLLVTDRRAAYRLVDDEGAVVESVGEAGKSHWQVKLIPARTDIGWLISDVAAQA